MTEGTKRGTSGQDLGEEVGSWSSVDDGDGSGAVYVYVLVE